VAAAGDRVQRLLALLLATTTACSVSHSNRGAAVTGGTALAIAGLVIARPQAVDSDGNGSNDYFLNDDYSGLIPGTLMFVGGLALLIAGLNSREPARYEPPPQPIATAESLAPPGGAVIAPLPEIAVTFEVLQLAKQLRSAASQSQCDAALATWARIHELDAAYATAIRKGPVLAPCLR
jgi:hypothetical protein